MDPESEKSSPARKWWLLIGVLVAFVVTFQLLEVVFRPEPAPAKEAPGLAGDANAMLPVSPAVPELRRPEDGAIEIRYDFFQRTTIRLDNEEDTQTLYDCLKKGFEESFGDRARQMTRSAIHNETNRIQNECMAFPLPPIPPTPGE